MEAEQVTITHELVFQMILGAFTHVYTNHTLHKLKYNADHLVKCDLCLFLLLALLYYGALQVTGTFLTSELKKNALECHSNWYYNL